MKLSRLDAVVLLLNAVAFGAFAVQWLFTTTTMAHGLGIELTNADAITDAQAIYGGMELGAGVFLAICALRPNLQRTGLLAATLLLGGLGCCRALGIAMAATPVTVATWKLLSTDALGTVVNGVTLFIASRRKPSA